MAGDDFMTLWRRLRQSSKEGIPMTLAMSLVNDAYRRVLDSLTWSFQYGLGRFLAPAAIDGTATVIFKSVNVTLSAAITPGDRTTIVGRQALFNSRAPIYNVVDNAAPDTLILDKPYGEASGSVAIQIVNAYFTPENSDFESLITMVDPVQGYQFRKAVNQAELNNLDPQRTSVNQPVLWSPLAYNSDYLKALPNTVTDSLGYTNASAAVPWYEVWPRPTSQGVYSYAYKRLISDLVQPTDRLVGLIRGNVVLEAAKAAACLEPGTPALPNPMYNPVYHNIHEARFSKMLDDMILRDKNVIERDLTWLGTMTNLPVYTARFIQTHLMSAEFAGAAM